MLWEPVDIDPADHNEIEKEDYKLDDDVNFLYKLEESLNKLRRFNEKLETSSDKDVILDKNILKPKYEKTGCKSNI